MGAKNTTEHTQWAACSFDTAAIPQVFITPLLRVLERTLVKQISTFNKTIYTACKSRGMTASMRLPHWTSPREQIYVCSALHNSIYQIIHDFDKEKRWAVLVDGSLIDNILSLSPSTTVVTLQTPLRTQHGARFLKWACNGLNLPHKEMTVDTAGCWSDTHTGTKWSPFISGAFTAVKDNEKKDVNLRLAHKLLIEQPINTNFKAVIDRLNSVEPVVHCPLAEVVSAVRTLRELAITSYDKRTGRDNHQDAAEWRLQLWKLCGTLARSSQPPVVRVAMDTMSAFRLTLPSRYSAVDCVSLAGEVFINESSTERSRKSATRILNAAVCGETGFEALTRKSGKKDETTSIK